MKAVFYDPKQKRNRQIAQRIEKIRALPSERLEELIKNRQLMNFLELKKGRLRGHNSTSPAHSLNPILVAAGRREIVGTKMGDVLKRIADGNLEVAKKEVNQDNYENIIRVLEIAGIADRKTRKIDLNAIRKCLEANRILHRGEW